MRKTYTKLVLRRETLRALVEFELAGVGGGQQGEGKLLNSPAECGITDMKSNCIVKE